ncbi:MAG TPA: hypothetical protein VFC46_15375, partial [Humisphaera sp.]|nr:hypothetical protein [Humisphaera sp.]
GKPFREDQIQLQIPQSRRDGGYFVAMVPVKQGEEPPRFETLPGGNAIRVIFSDRADTILLAPKPGTTYIDGTKIDTGSAVIVNRGGKANVTHFGAKE